MIIMANREDARQSLRNAEERLTKAQSTMEEMQGKAVATAHSTLEKMQELVVAAHAGRTVSLDELRLRVITMHNDLMTAPSSFALGSWQRRVDRHAETVERLRTVYREACHAD